MSERERQEFTLGEGAVASNLFSLVPLLRGMSSGIGPWLDGVTFDNTDAPESRIRKQRRILTSMQKKLDRLASQLERDLRRTE